MAKNSFTKKRKPTPADIEALKRDALERERVWNERHGKGVP